MVGDQQRIVKEFAEAFRAAIENVDRVRLGETFAHFPCGACSDASELLATALADHKLGNFDYVCGTRMHEGKKKAHAWLEGQGLTVDITADQFGRNLPKVIVAAQSCWHHEFMDVTNSGPAMILRQDDDLNRARLMQLYDELIGELRVRLGQA